MVVCLRLNSIRSVSGHTTCEEIEPGSNADLGLTKALSVVQELQNYGLKDVKFRTYSGAKQYLSSGDLSPLNLQPDETQRRIEFSN